MLILLNLCCISYEFRKRILLLIMKLIWSLVMLEIAAFSQAAAVQETSDSSNGLVVIEHQGNVRFEQNDSLYSDSFWGGAFHVDGGINIRNNQNVTFGNNYSTYGGGAIYCSDWWPDETGKKGVTISQNLDVIFYDNYAETYLRGGGAIYCDSSGDVIIKENRDVNFSGNYADCRRDGEGGGAIFAANIVISDNTGNVNFIGNGSASYGSAIRSEVGDVFIGRNANVTFQENVKGNGAIFCSVGEVNISQNADVIFFRNNGAINANNVCISNNVNVNFSENAAPLTSKEWAYGALYVDGNSSEVSIIGNDTVIFEKNYAQTSSNYFLSSIGGTCMKLNLAAKTGGYIMFYDAVHGSRNTELNADYIDADGVMQKADGEIIFNGSRAEMHLNAILEKNEVGRSATEQEIRDSQHSVLGAVTLYGGTLRVEDYAQLNVSHFSVAEGSHATVEVRNAVLATTAAHFIIEVNDTGALLLSKGGKVSGTVNIGEGAVFGAVASHDDITVVSDADEVYALSSPVGGEVEGHLTLEGGSALMLHGAHIHMSGDSILSLNTTGSNKIKLDLTPSAGYREGYPITLFSNVSSVNFTMDNISVAANTEGSVYTVSAAHYFSSGWINDATTLNFDSVNRVVYLNGGFNIPEPSAMMLYLLSLISLSTYRRRK